MRYQRTIECKIQCTSSLHEGVVVLQQPKPETSRGLGVIFSLSRSVACVLIPDSADNFLVIITPATICRVRISRFLIINITHWYSFYHEPQLIAKKVQSAHCKTKEGYRCIMPSPRNTVLFDAFRLDNKVSNWLTIDNDSYLFSHLVNNLKLSLKQI